MSQERSLDHFVDKLERRARSARAISVAITIGVVVIGAVTVFFTIRQIRKQISEERDKLAAVQKETAETQAKLDQKKIDLDLAQHQLDVHRNALTQVSTEQRQELLKKGEEITDEQNAKDGSATPNVFLQILDNNQRGQANAIAGKLKNNGFKVQGVEWVRIPVVIKQTQVKYFQPEFADEAQKIVGILKQSGIQANAISLNASAGQIEIWFSMDAFPSKDSGGTSQSSENLALAKAADGAIFEFFEALARPEDAAEATQRLQKIVATLERDREAAPYVAANKLSSSAKTGLRTGLENIRRAVRNDKKFDLLNRINRVIVDNAPPTKSAR